MRKLVTVLVVLAVLLVVFLLLGPSTSSLRVSRAS